MTFEIIWEFTKSFCVLFSIAFVFSKLNIIKKHLMTKPNDMREKIVLSLLFGLLGCVGSAIGIEFNDSLINTCVIGVAVGGLIGGPLVGILSGAIAGLHRAFFVSAGSATAVVCGISMVVEGALGSSPVTRTTSTTSGNWRRSPWYSARSFARSCCSCSSSRMISPSCWSKT